MQNLILRNIFFKYILSNFINSKNNLQVVLGCQITQHSRDFMLIKKFTSFFNCGRLETTREFYENFIVTKLLHINEIIIPFFEKYPLLGIKSKEFKYKINKIILLKINKIINKLYYLIK